VTAPSGERRFARGFALLAVLVGGACSDRNWSSPSGSGGTGAQGGTSANSAGGNAFGGLGERGGNAGQSGETGAPHAGGARTEGGAGADTGSGGDSLEAGAGGSPGDSVGGTGAGGSSAGSGGRGGTGGVNGVGGVGGTSGSTGAGGAAEMTVQEFCELLQPRARSWLRTCRLGFGDSSGWWGTDNIDSFCTSGRAAVEAGRLAYDPIRARACAAASVGDCNTIDAFALHTSTSWASGDACQGVVTPQVSLGAACHANSTRYSSECKNGFCGGTTCPGTCTAYPKVHESCDQNKPCDPTVHVCSAGTCEVYTKRGEACTANSICGGGLVCALDAPTPVCAEVRSLGQDCQWPSQCSGDFTTCSQNKCIEVFVPDTPCPSNICPDVAYCDRTTLTCKARKPTNGDCSDSDGVWCVEGNYCSSASKCTPYGRDGEACPCADNYWCDASNKCRPKGKLNTDCSESTTASFMSRCEEGLGCRPTAIGQSGPGNFVCTAAVGQGEPCFTNFNCQVPLFCEPTSSRCQAPGSKGEACHAGFPLDSCQAGLFCQCTGTGCTAGTTGPGVCQARADNGAACAHSSGCKSGICTNQKCVASTACP